MTAQASDSLIVEHQTIDINGLHCFGVVAGDPKDKNGWREKYDFHHKPNPPEFGFCSANWKSYIPTFRLTAEGALELLSYSYAEHGIEEIDPPEVLSGNFWLVLKERFFAPRLYIPFDHGTVVLDKNRWLQEKGESIHKLKGWSGRYVTSNLLSRDDK